MLRDAILLAFCMLCLFTGCKKASQQDEPQDEYSAEVYAYLNSFGTDSISVANAIKEAVDMYYEADSPYENEAMLLPFLRYASKEDNVPSYVKLRAQYLLDLVSKNMEGTKAQDFRYVSREGEEGSLYGLEAPQLMVIFYDPECTHCLEAMANIEAWEELEQQRQTGKVKVLAIYAEGKDSVWQATKDGLPQGWIVGRDCSMIEDNELYDLKAMPTVYLLDADKTVIKKDYKCY